MRNRSRTPGRAPEKASPAANRGRPTAVRGGRRRPRFQPFVRLQAYVRSHASNFFAALGRLSRQPLGSAMTIAVIGVALSLPAALHLLVTNANAASQGWQSAVDFGVYLHLGTPLQQAQNLAEDMRALPGVETVTLIPADQALAEFREYSGFGAALDVLQTNPLPHTLTVRPEAALEAAAVGDLAAALQALPEVEWVQLDTAWVERFYTIVEIARRLTLLAMGLLALAVVVIIGNTIRLDIQSRREEIEVVKMIGGSDAFIRRPFLYGGLWYGCLGGLLAVAVIVAGLIALAPPVEHLAQLYASDFRLQGLGWAGAGVVLGVGILLGWFGAWIATARHLRAIEPE